MLLVLEVILTASAWKRGWRGWALLPLAFGLFLGFVAGAFIGAMGIGDDASGLFILADVAVIVALIIMTVKPRRIEAKGYRPVEGATVANGADKATPDSINAIRNVVLPPKP